MAKLRHIAIAVPDIQATAKFYETSFGMHRVRESNVAVMLSDGVMSLAIIDPRNGDLATETHGITQTNHAVRICITSPRRWRTAVEH